MVGNHPLCEPGDVFDPFCEATYHDQRGETKPLLETNHHRKHGSFGDDGFVGVDNPIDCCFGMELQILVFGLDWNRCVGVFIQLHVFYSVGVENTERQKRQKIIHAKKNASD